MFDNQIDDSKLKEDVKQLFKDNSSNIQNVNDVFEMKQKLNIEVVVDVNDIYQKLHESKKIAQITLNLYNENEIYKDLEVLTWSDFKNPRKQKSSNDPCSVDGQKGSEGIDDPCSVDGQKGSEGIDDSCSGGKPDESQVIDRLYRYVHYFLIAKHQEIVKKFKDIFGEDHLENLECSMCENNISFNEFKCSLCGEYLLAICEGEINKHEKSKISEIINRKSCKTDSNVIGDVPNGDDKHKGEFDSEVAEKHDGNSLDCNKWKCKRCEFVNDDGHVNCTACMEARADWSCKHCLVVNELSSEQCSFCGGSREITSNNIENSEKDGTIEGWTCRIGKCLSRNGGNEQFCTACGIDKSASRERGAAVNMRKYGGMQQVWVCYGCGHINHDLNRSLCCRCFESKFDVEGGNKYDKMVDGFMNISIDKNDKMGIPRDKDDKMGIPRDKDDKMGIPRDNGANKWECDKCKSVNAREVLSCTHCHSPRMEMWSCKHCTMCNRISDDHCDACGKENENRIIKYCLECRTREIVCDNLCGDCWNARNENWTCWYRFCGETNPENETYCKNCGLDRYADKIKIGTPMMRCKGDVTDEIWICGQCYLINDISRYCCPDYHCRGRNKYQKWCRKCYYKYNYEYSCYCEKCNERIY